MTIFFCSHYWSGCFDDIIPFSICLGRCVGLGPGRSTVDLLLPACSAAMGAVLFHSDFFCIRSAQNKKKSISGYPLEFAECVENVCGVSVALWQWHRFGHGSYERRRYSKR